MPQGDRPEGWRDDRNQRRERLHQQFERSRRPHEPPPDPDHWEPQPAWRAIWQTLWDNPLLLLVVAIVVAVVIYFLFPPAWLTFC